MRFTASVTPYPTFLGSTLGITVAKARARPTTRWTRTPATSWRRASGFGSHLGRARWRTSPPTTASTPAAAAPCAATLPEPQPAAPPHPDRRPQPAGRLRSRPASRSPTPSGSCPSSTPAGLRRTAIPDLDEPRPVAGRPRPALLHLDRADPAGRRHAPRHAEGRQAGLPLHQHRAGLLMRAARAILLGLLGLAAPGGQAIWPATVPGRAQESSDQGSLASLFRWALSTPENRVRVGAVEGALSSDAMIRDVQDLRPRRRLDHAGPRQDLLAPHRAAGAAARDRRARDRPPHRRAPPGGRPRPTPRRPPRRPPCRPCR